MFSIEKEVRAELVIKKSKFIAIVFPIYQENDFFKRLEQSKIEHPQATHYCYAYKVGAITRMSDDGEPSKTAGAPILNLIEKQDLTNIGVIVVRYFGGIKLGSGGLVHAYSDTFKKALDESIRVTLIPAIKLIVSFSYENSKPIEQLLKDAEIIKKDFQDIITYTCIMRASEYQEKQETLEHLTLAITITGKTYISKKEI